LQIHRCIKDAEFNIHVGCDFANVPDSYSIQGFQASLRQWKHTINILW
jgi:hypothetical protein